MPHSGAVPARSHPIANPYATPYAFPEGKYRELAEYLNENTEYDPASGCRLWTGTLTKEGVGRALRSKTASYGTQLVPRLSWMVEHGRKLGKDTHLTTRCGNPACCHPEHLREMTPNDRWNDDDLGPPTRQGSVGALKLGKRILWAQEVYQLQARYPHPDPRKGLVWHYQYRLGVSHLDCPNEFDLQPHAKRELEVIRAVRRCPIRATLTVLPCGFRRYDLPAGITEIAFAEPPTLTYEEVFGWVDDDEDPETADEADWAIPA